MSYYKEHMTMNTWVATSSARLLQTRLARVSSETALATSASDAESKSTSTSVDREVGTSTNMIAYQGTP